MTEPKKKATPKKTPESKKRHIIEAHFHQGIRFRGKSYNQVNPDRPDQKNIKFELHQRGILMTSKEGKDEGYELLVPDSNIRYFVAVSEDVFEKRKAEQAKKEGRK